jgi:hypothetical protein
MFQNFLCRTPIPLAWLRLFEIEPVHQHRQLLGAHCHAALFFFRFRLTEAAFLQPLGAHPQSAAVPHQGFQTRARAIGKQEQVPAHRVCAELIANQPVQFPRISTASTATKILVASPSPNTGLRLGHVDQSRQIRRGERPRAFDRLQNGNTGSV